MAKDTLRVLHLGKYFPPEPGGMERFVDELSLEQVRQGLTPAVLVHDRRQSGREDTGGRTVWRCRSFGQWLFTPVAPTWPYALQRAIRAHRPDLLHLHSPNPSVFAALMLPAARRLPWIVHWHADIPLDTRHRGLRLAYPCYAVFERKMLARATAIITTSARYLDASPPLRAFRDRCHVVPLGLGPAPTPGVAPPWPPGELRVLAIGRLTYYKGFDRLIEAIARVPNASAMICGSGPMAAALRQQITVHGLDARVHLHCGLDDPTIEACLQSCDVLCLPSLDRAEAFGLVLLEAMRAGRAVIAADVPGSGIAEVVQADRTGLLVPPDDVPALTEALRRLAADRALRMALGRAGQERFQREYSITQAAASIEQIYRKALAVG